MNIDLIQLLIDVGLFVLIWIVQLVVYPSFLFYESENLVDWHQKYTPSISVVVIPLMLGQLTLAIFQLIGDRSMMSILYFVLTCCAWGVTFLIFVPIHSKISSNIHTKELLRKLVRYNWLRVVIWTSLFIISLSSKI